jgi:hypothetical protein
MQTVIMEEGESGEDLDSGGGGHAAWTWQQSGKQSTRHRRGPNDDRGGGRCDVEADAEEERARGVDPMVVGAASMWTRRRSGHVAWT